MVDGEGRETVPQRIKLLLRRKMCFSQLVTYNSNLLSPLSYVIDNNKDIYDLVGKKNRVRKPGFKFQLCLPHIIYVYYI